MEIKLKEQFNNLGLTGSTAWYELKASVESDQLDDIQQVEYFLEDQSISNPVILSGSSSNNFEVRVQSWKDNVPITATVTFKNENLNPVILTTENPIAYA